MSQDMPTAFCILCGASHILGLPCDPARLEWVRKRRIEIAQGVDWKDATPMPAPTRRAANLRVVEETNT